VWLQLYFIMMKKIISIILFSCMFMITDARPRIRITVEVGQMPSCSGSGICGVRVTLNLIRTSSSVNGYAEYDEGKFYIIIPHDAVDAELTQYFRAGNIFPVTEEIHLDEAIIRELDIPFNAISGGKYVVHDDGSAYHIAVNLN
jgi:hypothetical protein